MERIIGWKKKKPMGMSDQKDKRRKYYLHAKIKEFAKVKPRKKVVLIHWETNDNLDEVQEAVISEIRDSFGYSIQLEI